MLVKSLVRAPDELAELRGCQVKEAIELDVDAKGVAAVVWLRADMGTGR